MTKGNESAQGSGSSFISGVLTSSLVFGFIAIVLHVSNNDGTSFPFLCQNMPSSATVQSKFVSSKNINRGTCLVDHGPVPYILMTLGRSGSGSTWQIIGNLTGMETPSEEYTGGGSHDSQRFFKAIGPGDGGKWMLKNLCSKQKKFPSAAAVGFKWKPFSVSMYSPASLEGLELVAKSHDPQIKIVRSRRNLLDVMISKVKHKDSDAPAHCAVGDKKCLEKHLAAGTDMNLPTEKLLDTLDAWHQEEADVDDLLANMGLPHVSVTYEKLYHSDDATEWMRIFRFLGKGPVEGLTMDGVRGAMEHADTSNPSQRMTLANYDEVEKILKGSKYEHLLH